MIFDKFCGVIERNKELAFLKGWIQDVAIFEFEGPAQNTIPNDWPRDKEAENINDDFFLPFPAIAIEDAAGCEILIDMNEDQIGLNRERAFISVSNFDTPREMFNDSDKESFDQKLLDSLPKSTLAIQIGIIKECKIDDNGKFIYHGGIQGTCIVSKSEGMFTNGFLNPEEMTDAKHTQKLITSVVGNVITGIREISWFNRTENFVVRKSPIKEPKLSKKKRNRILRAHERPTYIYVGPQKLDKMFPIKETPNNTKQPKAHRRRAHKRVYTDKRYTNMLGKTQIIASQWIGPQEAVHGNRKYKVMLDI